MKVKNEVECMKAEIKGVKEVKEASRRSPNRIQSASTSPCI